MSTTEPQTQIQTRENAKHAAIRMRALFAESRRLLEQANASTMDNRDRLIIEARELRDRAKSVETEIGKFWRAFYSPKQK